MSQITLLYLSHRYEKPPPRIISVPSSHLAGGCAVVVRGIAREDKKFYYLFPRDSLSLPLQKVVPKETTKKLYDSCGETTILGTLYGAMERRTD
jgi:hypothetical protein